MKRNKKKIKKINNKVVLVIFFITMFLFGTSYAILNQELTLSGNVGIYIDEGTDLTVTNFNTSIDVIYTQYLFNIIPVSGYKVVGITFQNTLSKTINNWTVEFSSNHNVATKPNDNRLSAYLNPENSYDTVSYSNNTVTVKGSDTLAPGQSKTVYVFFSANLLNNNFSFENPKAYYTPPLNSGRSARFSSNSRTKSSNEFVKYDINSSDTFAVLIDYDTTLVADNLYSTTMYIFIGNNTGKDVSNIKFNVHYKDNNLSSLYSSTINIVENNESGASFISNDVIGNLSYKGYIVTGLKTYGSFGGMTIENVSYSTNGATEENNKVIEPEPVETEIKDTSTNNIVNEVLTNTTINTNTITQDSIQNEIVEETNTITDNSNILSENTIENTVTDENVTNEIVEGN